MLSVSPFIFPIIGALLMPLGNYVEKLIFNDPFGDVNKYYLIRNFFMTWGFIIMLLLLKYMEKHSIKFREAMNTISWWGYLKNRRLLALSVIASGIILMATYSQYIGIKFNPLSHYGPIYVMSYVIVVTFMGVYLLGEKLTYYKICAIVLALISIVMIWLDSKSGV